MFSQTIQSDAINQPVTGLALGLIGTNGTSVRHDQGKVPTQLDTRVGRVNGNAWGRCNLYKHEVMKDVSLAWRRVLRTVFGQRHARRNLTDPVKGD